MPALCSDLSDEKENEAAKAILTTDTITKEYATTFEIDGVTCTLGGMAKGSGMIAPNMATMLSFVTSDVAISSECLQSALKEVADDTYNMISIDGDTSTNDTFGILCNGLAGNVEITQKDKNYETFKAALYTVCEHISKMLAKDGEGASKLLTAKVSHVQTKKDAKIVAKSIVESTLLKCAMFGNDANWGRILCAIGYSDADLDINKVSVTLASSAGDIHVCEKGMGVIFDEDKALKVLSEDEIDINIDLNDGMWDATAWGCDLTYDYVKINGEYRT